MRVRIERTFLTTNSGTRVIDADPESVIVESESLTAAIISFITNDHARLLGTLSESHHRVAATAWKNRVYTLTAEPAPD